MATLLTDLSSRGFEQLLSQVWQARGWSTSLTSESGDDGVDVVATKDRFFEQKQLIQAKHRTNPAEAIPRCVVQQYAYLHQKQDVDEVFLITNGTFTSPARDTAATANIKLVDGQTLTSLIHDKTTDTQRLNYEIVPPSDESMMSPSNPPERPALTNLPCEKEDLNTEQFAELDTFFHQLKRSFVELRGRQSPTRTGDESADLRGVALSQLTEQTGLSEYDHAERLHGIEMLTQFNILWILAAPSSSQSEMEVRYHPDYAGEDLHRYYPV